MLTLSLSASVLLTASGGAYAGAATIPANVNPVEPYNTQIITKDRGLSCPHWMR
ncbi:hypothetical protein J7E73_22000 [Paenibacillus albidus]|uniref:hypothetical protein n=1 Tax=Paenibacillus albidus TaxID=2041023 RepID=UPI001BE83088|nr:hypothetical protein [Paenibacillus albidus]MBT2291751.1 hypothetical protein [Paenibacillus albidus]